MKLNKFATTAATIVMEAFAAYAAKNDLSTDSDGINRALLIMRANTRAGLDAAMSDAKQAIDAGMPDAAAATFRASMTLIGIASAKQYAEG